MLKKFFFLLSFVGTLSAMSIHDYEVLPHVQAEALYSLGKLAIEEADFIRAEDYFLKAVQADSDLTITKLALMELTNICYFGLGSVSRDTLKQCVYQTRQKFGNSEAEEALQEVDRNLQGISAPPLSPLCAALKLNLPDYAKFFIERGDDINERNEKGDTPVYLACYHRFYDIALLLVNKGADLEEVSRGDLSLLHLLAIYGEGIELASLLINKGHDVNKVAVRNGGVSPIHFASRVISKLPMLKLLVEHGADVNIRAEKTGYTPLHFAVRFLWKEAAELLLEKGALINALAKRNESCLYVLAEHGDSLAAMGQEQKQKVDEMLNFLLDNGADATLPTTFGSTAFHEIARWSYAPGAIRLLESCENLNITDAEGETPLHRAARSEREEILNYLLSKNVNRLIRNKNDQLAADVTHNENIRKLLL